MSKEMNSEGGFTLVELIVVVAIVGVLTSLSITYLGVLTNNQLGL